MSKIYYAIEVETETTVTSAGYGLNYGYFRFITDRPAYNGSDTGGTLPIGDHCGLKIGILGTENINTAFISGQLYTATSAFKTVNTVPLVQSRFTVLDDVDFTDSKLATAKGSAPAEGDMFEVTNNGSGTEAIKYIGVNKWYRDLITRDGMTNSSRSVDLEGTGDYGTLSGFTFAVNCAIIAGTDTPIWSALATLAVPLANKKVRLFAVIDDVFYQIWTGIIDHTNNTETEFQFDCRSNFKAAHKDIPPETDSDGNTTPICIGDVEYARILGTSQELNYISLVWVNGYFSKLAQATDYSEAGPSIQLKTPARYFEANELAGKYLFVDSGGTTAGDSDGNTTPDKEIGLRIVSNTASASDETLIYLAEPIQGFVLATHGYAGSAGLKNLWNFKISDFQATGYVSDGAISTFKLNSQSKEILTVYNNDTDTYDDTPFIVYTATPATAAVTFKAPGLSTSGSVFYRDRIRFTIDSITQYPSHVNLDSIVSNASIPLLIDRDRTTGASWSDSLFHGIYAYSGPSGFTVSISLTDKDEIKNASKVYLGVDYKITNALEVGYITTTITTGVIDQYGRDIVDYRVITYSDGNTDKNRNMLQGWYYSNGGNPNGELSSFGSVKSDALLDDYIVGLLKDGRPVTIKVVFSSTDPTYVTNYMVKEIGLWAEYDVDISKDIFARVSGEMLPGSIPCNNVYNAYRLMLESYDGISGNDIDYGNIGSVRMNWYVGKQLTERKNTADYILELCQQSFVAGYQNRRGKIAFSAWRERTDTPHAHTQAVIIRDTIRGWEPIGIDKIFNTFTVNYSYDPAGNKYFSTLQIWGVDDIANLPLSDNATLFNICRACYLEYKTIKEFKIDLSWFNDRLRWYNEGESGWGIGTDGSAWKFLMNAVFWLTRQRRNVEYNIPLNATNVLCELCDPITFQDTIYTNASIVNGTIHTIEYDIKSDQIIIGAILDPLDTIDSQFGDIIESGSQSDTITESGSQTNTYTEDGL